MPPARNLKRRKSSLKASNTTKTAKPSAPQPVHATNNVFPKPDTAFKALISARFCAAIWSHITDCDETFNYWEPLHYLLYGQGLQTWEYSPEFALRSYTYLLIHGVPAWIYEKIFHPNPMLIFYFVRCVLAIGCAGVEVYFYKAIAREFGVHLARLWLMFQLFSPGMFIASAALLPSSFSMYFSTAALAAWWHQNYRLAIFFTAISVVLGWPFAGLLSLPLIYDVLVRKRKLRTFVFWSGVSAVTLVIPAVVIDSSYFGKVVVAPLNLILYNVFTSHGPDLYGVEPASFYLINGFLNFNLVWLMALIAPLMLLVSWLFVPARSRSTLSLPYWLSLAPLYLWLAVFALQPHKEERFLFPIYPLISLCGAISVDVVQKLFFRVKRAVQRLPLGQHYLDHTALLAALFVVVYTLGGLSRILALYRSYHAPMDVLMELGQLPEPHSERNVCVGKDWYRFPGSFFLPSRHYRLRFLPSEFRGMLPAYFPEGENGTQLVPPYFNDLNQENEDLYFDYERCDFLVDLDFGRYTELEPDYASDTKDWTLLKTLPFLDAAESHPTLRAFFVPFLSDRFTQFGLFNLLQRRKTTKV